MKYNTAALSSFAIVPAPFHPAICEALRNSLYARRRRGLVDVTAMARLAGVKCPTAVTIAVWDAHIAAHPSNLDKLHVLFDLLSPLRQLDPNTTSLVRVVFLIPGSDIESEAVLVATPHFDADGREFFTVMSPHE